MNAALPTGLRERIRQLVESEETAVPRARRDALAAVKAAETSLALARLALERGDELKLEEAQRCLPL